MKQSPANQRYLDGLKRRGLHPRMVNGALVIQPKEQITPALKRSIKQALAQIRWATEVRDAEHRKAVQAMAERVEAQVLQQLQAGRITQDTAEARLLYAFRLAASCAGWLPPCSKCGCVLLWSSPDGQGRHLTCYKCFPPPDGMSYWLADSEAKPAKPLQENLEHTEDWS